MDSDSVKPESSSSVNSASESDARLMTVEVRQSMKHPMGHTVYECVVGITSTRQVWILFKRYRDFVALRQQLKDLLNQREPQPTPTSTRNRSHPPAKGGEGAVKRGSRMGTGDPSGAAALAKSVKAVLSSQKFPNKLTLGGSAALQFERRKAFHAFLAALIRLRPLPEIVARFLGLLEDNRMVINKDGNYVQAVHTDKIVPMPVSPGHGSKPRSKKNQSTRNGNDLDAAATATAPAAYPEGEGAAPIMAPGATMGRRNLQPQLQKQPGVGTRAWEGVPAADRRRPASEAERGWSDTDVPTDIESGSDSEPESAQDVSAGETGVAAKTGSVQSDHARDRARHKVDGRGVVPGRSVPLSRGVLVRGGGGGVAPDGREGYEEEAGWTMVGGERGREETRERVAEQAERVEDKDVSEELKAGLIQREFMNGYFAEVVSKVVGRRDLEHGMGGRGGARSNDSINLDSCLTVEERNIRMAELQSLGVDLDTEKLLLLLRYNDWGPEATTALYQDLKAAGKGFLERVTPGTTLRGMENGGNTCYIDSLLFAMFATVDAFDWLLIKSLSAKDPPEVKIFQKHLRFWVNQLRRGAIIPREHSNLIRSHIRSCGWHGGSSTQEDVSELFTFLVGLLRCPALPLSEALFHGGKTDASDSRVSTERALYLALPEDKERARPTPVKSLSPASGGSSRTEPKLSRSTPPTPPSASPSMPPSKPSKPSMPPLFKSPSTSSSTNRRPDAGTTTAGTGTDTDGTGSSAPVTLEQILMYNFHDNRIEGLRRTVSGEKESQSVDAWRMVSMLPFYALSGEHAGDADISNDRHFDRIMLPMVLKRYEAEALSAGAGAGSVAGGGATKKSRRKVIVPHRLDCSRFMAPTGEKEGVAQHGRFVLVLRSAVCHLGGESVSRGHYIAYAADRCPANDGGRSKKEPEKTDDPGRVAREKEALLSVDSHDSVSWLRLDDMKRGPAGKGFVERLESMHDANLLFSEHLGLHSYMLFYELVPLDLDDADKAKFKEKYALIETQSDYELALQFDMMEGSLAGPGGRGVARGNSNMCPVS